ncbi:hypothetical protein ACFQVC_21475 [Streptomyces monticola]|uniref:Extensin n=1 Tax=Streptomyces monticola TaxID=2666263 RepID=A0ABW2JL11_9ACTN
MSEPSRAETANLLRTLTRVLGAVAVLTLVFTATNVTLFAVGQGVPLAIAVLLDPMVALALAAVLYADARLGAWGIRPPGWSTALRWGAGLAAALLNVWTSLWPDGSIGWPREADVAGVVLHLMPPLLLIALTETIAAYRRIIAGVQADLAHPGFGAGRGIEVQVAPDTEYTAPPPLPAAPAHQRPGAGRSPASDGTALSSSDGPTWADVADSADEVPPIGQEPLPCPERAPEGGLFNRARALDEAARAHTGRPISIRQLRRQLHLGQVRARSLRTQLDALHPEGAPRHETRRENALEQGR